MDPYNSASSTRATWPSSPIPTTQDERLIACRNPLLAEERKRKRSELLAATEEALAPIISAVREGRLVGADKIGLKVGKVINKFKMAKHFEVSIGENTLSVSRHEDAIAAEAALDGIYVLRTTIKESDLDAPGVVDAYKALSHVERDFRHLKIDDIDLRPIHHRLEARVRSHVFICMLASYLVWHLRETLAPLTFTDEAPPVRANPVAPAVRSAGARAKAAAKENEDGRRGTRVPRAHRAPGRRSRATPCGPTTETTSEFELLATPTPTQRRVFELLGAPVPLKLS